MVDIKSADDNKKDKTYLTTAEKKQREKDIKKREMAEKIISLNRKR